MREKLAGMSWSGAGAILLGLTVVLGAFGAHGLRGRLDSYAMGIYDKAVFYQFVHALGILMVLTATISNFIAPHFVDVQHGLRQINDWSPHNCLGPKP